MKLTCLSAVKRVTHCDATSGKWKWTYGLRPEPAAAYVDAVAVLDRSGSMAPLLPGAQAGVQVWLEKQKGTKNGFVEVVTFDDIVEKPYSGLSSMMMRVDIHRCMEALKARGMTRLYDTAVEAIHRQMKRLVAWKASLPKARMVKCLSITPIAVLFVLTDGLDNRSTVANAAAFKRALAQTVGEWKTVTIFAAANQNAMAAGRSYGFNPATILQMDAAPAAVTAVFKSATASQMRACSGAPPRMTQMERMTSAPSWHKGQTAPACLGGGYDSDDSDDSDSDNDSHMATMGGGGVAVTPVPIRPRRQFYQTVYQAAHQQHNSVVFQNAQASGRSSLGLPTRFLMSPPPRPRLQRHLAASPMKGSIDKSDKSDNK